MTISEFLKETTEKFIKAGIAAPRLDAEIIISFTLKIKRHKLLTDGDMPLSENEISRMKTSADRRLNGEPVAYITGVKEFYSLEFNVDKDVLIPRPETELLVDLLLFHSAKNARVLDLGTGSGAIAVALKYNRPDISMFASDISFSSLTAAKSNCTRILGGGSIAFLCGDLLGPFRNQVFDVIVSNPPYLDQDSKGSLQREIGFEPAGALFAGNRGRAIIIRIINDAKSCLKQGGFILMEIGSEMSDFIRTICTENNISVSIFNDYSDMPRAALFRYI
ncbi:MAG: peptide chain release factor N(5)-glutamine methyltransferase [Spirochaetes bacterium]|nr:peptide chain release factor N(5)-glutamine methyltransferase [Spirochaetota bacterium]